jgi:chemotaxis protein methyltransferase CheR
LGVVRTLNPVSPHKNVLPKHLPVPVAAAIRIFALDPLQHIHFAGVEMPSTRVARQTASCIAAMPRVARNPGTRGTRAPERGETDPFLAWLLQRAGLRAAAYRPNAMQRRLASCLRQVRASSPDSARAFLERAPELIPGALNALLVGVTEFFRDTPVFESLRVEFLPQLLTSRRQLRVYSAGAASGQELYSVAMLLAEAGALERCELFGMDCRPDAIEAARAGWFDERDVRGLDRRCLEKYFDRQNAGWLARPELRANIRWQTGDLFSFEDGPWDLILYRNVAIYFEADHASQAWERLCRQLAPGGLLVTGKAERPPYWLPLVRVSTSIYRKSQE